MSAARGPMAPATYLLTDGVELYARRTGPLNTRETFREPAVIAQCDLCERIQLKRYLVKKVKLDIIACFGGCRSADAFSAAEVRTDAAIDAMNLPHETLRAKVARGAEARALLVAPPAPPPSTHIIHGCRTCKRDFTHEAWLKLELLQVKEVTEDGVVELHDMRNCVCGSTLLMISEREKGTVIYYRGGGQ